MRESGERTQERRLPCSVVAEDGVKASGVEFGGDAAQGGEASKLLDHVANGDGGSSRVSHGGQADFRAGAEPRASLTAPVFQLTILVQRERRERRDHFALPHRREAGRRGYGRRLQGRGHASSSFCCIEVPAGGNGAGPVLASPL